MAAINHFALQGAEIRSPGVYLEEVVPQSPALFRTGVPAFIGFVQKEEQSKDWPDERSYVLTRWEQFKAIGRPVFGGFLEYSVRGFFENGGAHCFIIPLKVPGEPDAVTLIAALRSLFTKDAEGLRGILEDIKEADLICMPDVMMRGIREDRQTVFDLQREVLEYCNDMGDRFAILDVAAAGERDRDSLARINKAHIESATQHWQELVPAEGALYFPWIRVEPMRENPHDYVPPCGHIAGIYARTDAEIGVHKAPANEIVEGAMDLQVHLPDEGQSELNNVGVNCLRTLPGRGIRVWGARTLSGLPNWRYVNVRRLFITLVRWIDHNMNDVAFEPNAPPLWDRVRDRLGAYCYDLFERGALKGREPAEAFFVKCDAETNPLDEREVGKLICHVGLAPSTPAEFLTVRITHTATGVTVATPTGV
jgi:uncharacterized protein